MNIVHSDLKSENILINFNYKTNSIDSVKLIDFGTSFEFENLINSLYITTPEYLPPEVLQYLEPSSMQ